MPVMVRSCHREIKAHAPKSFYLSLYIKYIDILLSNMENCVHSLTLLSSLPPCSSTLSTEAVLSVGKVKSEMRQTFYRYSFH